MLALIKHTRVEPDDEYIRCVYTYNTYYPDSHLTTLKVGRVSNFTITLWKKEGPIDWEHVGETSQHHMGC